MTTATDLEFARDHIEKAAKHAERVRDLILEVMRRGDVFPEKRELIEESLAACGELVCARLWVSGVTLEEVEGEHRGTTH